MVTMGFLFLFLLKISDPRSLMSLIYLNQSVWLETDDIWKLLIRGCETYGFFHSYSVQGMSGQGFSKVYVKEKLRIVPSRVFVGINMELHKGVYPCIIIHVPCYLWPC